MVARGRTPSCARDVGADFPPSPPPGRPRLEVRSEQVLLSLIAHGEGVAARVLAELGVDLEKAATATTHVRFPRPVHELFGPAVLQAEVRTEWKARADEAAIDTFERTLRNLLLGPVGGPRKTLGVQPDVTGGHRVPSLGERPTDAVRNFRTVIETRARHRLASGFS